MPLEQMPEHEEYSPPRQTLPDGVARDAVVKAKRKPFWKLLSSKSDEVSSGDDAVQRLNHTQEPNGDVQSNSGEIPDAVNDGYPSPKSNPLNDTDHRKLAAEGYVMYEASEVMPLQSTAMSLSDHLLRNALAGGWYQDVSVRILGQEMRLHRVILSRSPFFRKMFLENPDDEKFYVNVTDPALTEHGVDQLIQYLYGSGIDGIEHAHAIATLIAAEYFEMPTLAQHCVDFVIEAINAQKTLDSSRCYVNLVAETMQFIDSRGMSHNADQLETFLLQFLCVMGYTLQHDVFLHMPAAWLQRIIEADAFYCPDEFSRYTFARNCIRRRLTCCRNESDEAVYAEIFQCAIIYTHMTFEQLDEVRADGVVPEAILMQSLWQQTTFKAGVESSLSSAKYLALNRNPDIASDTNAASRVGTKPLAEMIAPLRMGLHFEAVDALKVGDRAYSQTFFYGGSWWTAFLQWFPPNKVQNDLDSNAVQETESNIKLWGVFLRRCQGEKLTKQATAQRQGQAEQHIIDDLTGSRIPYSISYYNDKRISVLASFKLFNPCVKVYDPIFESKPNEYGETQSWGYRSANNINVGIHLGNKMFEAEDPSIKLTLVLRYH